jgi:hypothetical protein
MWVRILLPQPIREKIALVAQLAEVLHLECKGCQFESDQGHHLFAGVR